MKDRTDTDRLFFSTFTNLYWIKVLELDIHKLIVIDSLEFLVKNNRINLYCYVIMPNHIHLIWYIKQGHLLQNVQRDFLKFTAQHIKYQMMKDKSPLLKKLTVNASDRKIQVWERNGLSFPLRKKNTILQKLNYIHQNPVKSRNTLAVNPADYRFSSANFYETEKDEFGILSHIHEMIF